MNDRVRTARAGGLSKRQAKAAMYDRPSTSNRRRKRKPGVQAPRVTRVAQRGLPARGLKERQTFTERVARAKARLVAIESMPKTWHDAFRFVRPRGGTAYRSTHSRKKSLSVNRKRNIRRRVRARQRHMVRSACLAAEWQATGKETA